MTDLVPVSVAAEEFGVSGMSLYRYIKQGRITGFRRELDGKTLVDRHELLRLAEPKPIRPDTKR